MAIVHADDSKLKVNEYAVKVDLGFHQLEVT